MAKVTSKLQVTIPKALAEAYGLEPGDEIDFQPAGPCIRIVPLRHRQKRRVSVEEAIRIFDESVKKQHRRWKELGLDKKTYEGGRGWTREELYDRDKDR